MKTQSPTADVAAIGLSSLCLVHCLLLPALAVTLPLAGLLSELEWLHRLFVLAAVPISAFAFLSPTARPALTLMRGLAVLGCASLVSGAFVEAWHDHETALTVAGAVLLIAAHALRIGLRPHRHD
ncbi:MAG: MerC domain-containing protein [Litorimonas sp.]